MVKKPPELRNIVTMADLLESFDDVSEKMTKEILQQGKIMLYEEEDEDKDPLGRLSKHEVAENYSSLP